MNCIRCNGEAGYNRVVVDTVSGRELGHFCRNCEFEEFGRALERLNTRDRSCVMCNRDGHVAVAPWTPTLADDGRQFVSEVDYDVTDRTPFLCDEHFHAVTDADDVEDEPPGRVRR